MLTRLCFTPTLVRSFVRRRIPPGLGRDGQLSEGAARETRDRVYRVYADNVLPVDSVSTRGVSGVHDGSPRGYRVS